MPTATILKSIDVREVRGTYLVTTMSGAHYTVEAAKRVSGGVTIAGGSKHLDPHPAVLVDPVVRFNERISSMRPYLLTSAVCLIRRIDGLSPEAVDELKTGDRQALAQTGHNGPAWWSDLVPASW